MTHSRRLPRAAALALFAATVAGASHAQAAEVSTAELLAQIRALKAQVEALEARVEAQAQTQATTQSQVAEAGRQAQQAIAETSAVRTQVETLPTQVTTAVAAANKPSWADRTSINGRMYFNLSAIDQESSGTDVAPSGYGFDVKRFYLGVDHVFDDTFSGSITMDTQYQSATGSTSLFIKKAYLQANLSKALTLRLGAADMPWIPFVEGLYGYRHLEQVITDRTRYGTSADWGLHASGALGPHVGYAVSVVNGAGFRAPLRSKGMDVEARVNATWNGFTLGVGGYSGKLGRDTEGSVNVLHTARRLNAVAAYAKGPLRAGVEYFSATNWNNVTTAVTDKAQGYSSFASYGLTPKISVFARYDWVQPRRTTTPGLNEDYFNVGIQYEPVRIVDLALVYKRDRVEGGLINTANSNIGGTVGGTYDEVGLFGQFRW